MAITNPTQAIAGGFERLLVMTLDSDGFYQGNLDAAIPTGATGAAPYRLLGVKTSNIQVAQPQIDTATGDDGAEGTLIFPPVTLPQFDITVAVTDLTFDALVQQTLAASLGNSSYGVLQPNDPNYIDVALLGIRRAKSKATATNGGSMWEGVIIPKANIVPLGSEGYTERGIATYKYRVIANPTGIMPTGLAIGNSNFGTTGAPIIPFLSPNRIGMYGWRGNNSAVAFNLPKSAFTLVGTNIATTTLVYNEGTLVTSSLVVVISTDPQTFTFGAAPATSARLISLFEYSV